MKFLSTIILTLFTICTIAQNLVPNPSFEDTIACPLTFNNDDSLLTKHWFQPTIGSSDFYHGCSSPTQIGVPDNLFGNQVASSGQAYAGLYTYTGGVNSREYISIKLLDSLVTGTNYYVSFNVSLADEFLYASKIGAYIGNDSIDLPFYYLNLNLLPQIESNGAVTDKLTWTRISGIYQAIGGEEYLTIGNFRDSTNSDATFVGNGGTGWAYYYIDDVCISQDSLSCFTFTDVEESQIQHDVNIYPTPTSHQLSIDTELEIYEINIIDISGKTIKTITTDLNIVNVDDLSDGIYFIKVNTEERTIIKKFIKH